MHTETIVSTASRAVQLTFIVRRIHNNDDDKTDETTTTSPLHNAVNTQTLNHRSTAAVVDSAISHVACDSWNRRSELKQVGPVIFYWTKTEIIVATKIIEHVSSINNHLD